MLTRHRKFFIVAIVLITLSLAFAPLQEVLPGEQAAQEVTLPTNLFEFAGWLALNGLTIAALLEKFGPYQKLNAKTKGVIALVLSIGAPYAGEGLAYLLTQVSPEQVARVQHYLDLALKGLNLYAASQYAHGGLRQFLPAPK